MKTAGLAVLALMCTSISAMSQVEVPLKEEIPPYNVDAISFAANTPKLSRLDVFVQVPYENLSFLKKDGIYIASYEMTIDILDSTGRLVSEKLWTEEVKAETFEQSASPQAYSLVQRVFEVSPGPYSIVTIMRDNETRQNQKLTRRITVSDYSSSDFSLSDIMLVSKLNIVGEKKNIVPNVSPNVGPVVDAFHVFFEVYNKSGLDSVRFAIDVLNELAEKARQDSQVRRLSPGRNQIFSKIEHGTLPIGDYTLYVRAFSLHVSPGSEMKYIATTSRTFIVRWRGLPKGIKDIEAAIEQCVYEAKDSEMKQMREGKTPDEKQKHFLEFWKKRDPNPNTPRNEKMEEYFARVEYANKMFKHYIEGWRTDMGMVYIMFGPPSNVERHPFDIDAKPHEIWTYYDLNHSFVFVDRTGFGDYRLTTPISDVWQRRRD